jgi:arginine/ornithine N-succinyltransferase beta subunit
MIIKRPVARSRSRAAARFAGKTTEGRKSLSANVATLRQLDA